MQTINPATKADLYGNKFEVVSVAAYLMGVPKRFFDNTVEPPKIEVYQQLDQNKNARIFRHLCILRTACMKNFNRIDKAARQRYTSIASMKECVPQESIMALYNDGVDLTVAKASKQKGRGRGVVLPPESVVEFITTLNRLITDRLNNIKALFPIWLNWEYVKDLFLMPSDAGTIQAEKNVMHENMRYYPYQCYIHWEPFDCGNMLYNDNRFVTTLYELHNDTFGDQSRVKTVQASVKDDIYNFIDGSQKIVMMVDCENSDAYRLCATLRDMDKEMRSKISKVILCDDQDFTPDAWRIFAEHTDVPLEHLSTERVVRNKSLVDVVFTSAVCKEHYANNIDSFIVVSSDSDYYGLIKSLPNARFMVMVEHAKVGNNFKKTLTKDGIIYCYIDDFYSGSSLDLAHHALIQGIRKEFSELTGKLNVKKMMDKLYISTGVHMGDAEKKAVL